MVFAPALAGGFVWDDHALIEDDARIHALPSLGELLRMPFFPNDVAHARSDDADRSADAANAVYYRPVLKLLHALQYQAFGATPFGYHVVNWLLHAGNVLLALAFLRRRLEPQAEPGADVDSSASVERRRLWLAIALGVVPFALHPSRTLAVAWVSGSGDLLFGTFTLACLLLWQARSLTAGHIIALLASSACATLTKEAGAVIVAVLLSETLLLAPRAAWPMRWVALGAMSIVQLGILSLRTWAIQAAPHGPFADGLLALISRLSVSLGFAIKALLLPTGLRHQLNYALGNPQALPFELQALGVLGLLSGLAIVVFIGRTVWRARRAAAAAPITGPSYSQRAIASDLALFALLLVPGLNVVTIGSQGGTLSERYLYVPMLGVAALCARGFSRWVVAAGPRHAVMGGAVVAALYASSSIAETTLLRDDRSLYARFVSQDPTEVFSVNGLLREAVRTGDTVLAQRCNAHRLCVIASVLAKTGSAGDQTNAALRDAVLAYLELELHLSSDLDQDRLRELRSMLDELSRGAPLQRLWRAAELKGPPATLTAVLTGQAGARTRLLRAIAYARTFEADEAAAILQTSSLDRSPEETLWLARIAIARSDVSGADAASRALQGSAPPPLLAALQRASQLAPADGCATPAVTLGAARALSQAGLAGLARKRLASCPEPAGDDFELTAIEVDLSDKQLDRAEHALVKLAQRARALEPEQAVRAQQLAARAQALLEQRAHYAQLAQPCLPCSAMP